MNKKQWKPKYKKWYWHMSIVDGIYAIYTNKYDCTFDINSYKLGNCFKTRKLAEQCLSKIKKVIKEARKQ